jgi:hypothetical protein
MSTISQARPVMVPLGLLNVDLFLQAISGVILSLRPDASKVQFQEIGRLNADC